MNVVSFFAGCGGLDLGFEQAGFRVVWANELDSSIHATYEKNHVNTLLCKDDINTIDPKDIPNCDGFIGGPPCQSWSVAGAQKGLEDSRGQLFLKYISLIRAKMPKFFLIENVKGLLDGKFKDVFEYFLRELESIGYNVKYQLLDAVDYDVPQNRERVFLIGFRHDLGIEYEFPLPNSINQQTLREAIGDIKDLPIPCDEDQSMISANCYYSGKFSSYYYRGNRRRSWDKPSFTIHATGSNAPLHPSSPEMIYNAHENWSFSRERMKDYRRLTVRECARIQTFPDTFEIVCDNILDAYKMIGNAVPVKMAEIIAASIKSAIEESRLKRQIKRGVIKSEDRVLVGYYKDDSQWEIITQQGFYFVRNDGRKGSISIEKLAPLPRLLLLHSGRKVHLFELVDSQPRTYDKDFIKRLGFRPCGDSYIGLGFDTSVSYDLETLGIDKDAIKFKNKFAPYITTFDKITSHKKKESLRFIDLFAGLGGFHFALGELGHECVFASELREDLQKLYQVNFPNTPIQGDITKINVENIPAHDILCAGFPCQPFSQAGKRQGFNDEKNRGNLFTYICKILAHHHPQYVFLENVSNLKGHDKGNTWKTILRMLNDLNYDVAEPAILSPHEWGIPQHRRRIYIVCRFRPYGDLSYFKYPVPAHKMRCDIKQIIDENDNDFIRLKQDTREQLELWQQFIDQTVAHNQKIPRFPIWAMEFGADYDYRTKAPAFQSLNELRGRHGHLGGVIDGATKAECLSCLPVYAQTDKTEVFPEWKIRYIEQNREFYYQNKDWLDPWIEKVKNLENSHLKLEWNCGDKAIPTLNDKIIQFRASGIRVKLPTFSPALNLVGTQIPIFPWVRLPQSMLEPGEPCFGRYMTRKEASRLQGMDRLKFEDDSFTLSVPRSFEALGNAVNVKIVKYIAEKLLQ